jgi:hypothetical protein
MSEPFHFFHVAKIPPAKIPPHAGVELPCAVLSPHAWLVASHSFLLVVREQQSLPARCAPTARRLAIARSAMARWQLLLLLGLLASAAVIRVNAEDAPAAAETDAEDAEDDEESDYSEADRCAVRDRLEE